MDAEIESAKKILREFLSARQGGFSGAPDRPEIVAHATLSALSHHWPSRSDAEILSILEATSEIKRLERSRWMTQRRIAIAKLARA